MDWLAAQPQTADLRVGYFGASTGGGAALVAAAERPERVGAVVSRGGRPDLAGPARLVPICDNRHETATCCPLQSPVGRP